MNPTKFIYILSHGLSVDGINCDIPSEAINAIHSLDKKLVFDIGKLKLIPKIETITDNKYLNSSDLTKYQKHKAICISFEFMIDSCDMKIFDENGKYNKAIFSVLSNIIDKFFIMLNIAYPGSINVLGRLIEENGKIERSFATTIYGSNLSRFLGELDFEIWPKLKILNLAETWEWFTNNRDVFEGKYDKPLYRCFCSYANVLGGGINLNEEIALLWSMIGIESVYAANQSHDESIIQQIYDRTSFLLGENLNYKRIMKDTYKIRSKFIHGKLNFPGFCYRLESEDNYTTFYNKHIGKAVVTSMAVVAATLQYAIEKKWNDIVFNNVLSVSDKSV